MRVVIGVATYKRPEMLRAALGRLEQLRVPDHCQLAVLVIDNDEIEQGGRALTKRLCEQGYAHPLLARVATPRGFTYARNAILECAFAEMCADVVGIVDDDQLVEPTWLQEALNTLQETKATIVGTAVVSQFTSPPPKWLLECDGYTRDTTTNGRVERLCGDGGVIISRAALDLLPLPWYRHEFALSGGADSELFLRLSMRGAVFARAAKALVFELYGPSRTNLSWALRRAFRVGCVDMLISKMHFGYGTPTLLLSAKIIPALLLSPIMILAQPHRAGSRAKYMRKMARAAGKISALLGHTFQEYTVIHGN